CKVAIDGRDEEVYSDELIGDIARLHYSGSNWHGVFQKYDTDVMLIPVAYKEVYDNIKKLYDWKLIYKDDIAAVFVPKNKSDQKWQKIDEDFDINKEKFISRFSQERK
ncbi:MAG: hypothetical protein PHV68_03480, partial [Candidatus Gastranaerophilales bacterium]|nr:hypothetical protein [Candidatus Gastranaerophilales bacterium]